MELNLLSVTSAAARALENMGRTSLSGEGFSRQEISAISRAIADAIAEYDRQKSGSAQET